MGALVSRAGLDGKDHTIPVAARLLSTITNMLAIGRASYSSDATHANRV